MRKDEVLHKLDCIRRQLGRDQQDIDLDQLQQYAVDGTLPEDPLTLAYVELSEAATAMMDASIGGQGYDEAVEAYQRAQERYQQVSREVTP